MGALYLGYAGVKLLHNVQSRSSIEALRPMIDIICLSLTLRFLPTIYMRIITQFAILYSRGSAHYGMSRGWEIVGICFPCPIGWTTRS